MLHNLNILHFSVILCRLVLPLFQVATLPISCVLGVEVVREREREKATTGSTPILCVDAKLFVSVPTQTLSCLGLWAHETRTYLHVLAHRYRELSNLTCV